jgi:rRNA-processing protein FCF1
MKSEPNQKEKQKIILDSNALFLPLQFKVDIFTEIQKLLNKNFELILLSPVKHELEMLIEKSPPKTRKNAKFALDITEKFTYVVTNYPPNTPVDDIIIKTASRWGCPVVTNDKLLRKRLRDISVPVIYLRQKSHLEIDGMI